MAAERARLQTRRDNLAQSADDTCPTCGSDLTEVHRADVLAGYDADLARLGNEREDVERDRTQAVERRDALRSEYVSLAQPIEAGTVAASAVQAGVEALRQQAQATERLDALRAEARELQRQLESDSYNPKLRSERSALLDAVSGDGYEPEAHSAARDLAALHEHWKKQVRSLSVASERLAQSRTERERKRRDLDARRQSLDLGEPTADLSRKMAALDHQVASLGYDAAQHDRVGQALRELVDAPKRLSALLDARRRRAEDGERKERLAQDRTALTEEAAKRQTALDALSGRLAQRVEAERAVTEAAGARGEVAERLSKAQGHLGALDERLARAERDRQRRAEVRKELKAVLNDRALYGHLRRAFGKNGIPSLIIEETLPEIEARANQLLDRLSKGRTRVTLETLKDKKTGGGTKETLDIRITDEQGAARSYETFSGGEAFRVNFALRIALSQMLAERAGTQIRTLVIDEGFGTQDAEGLQALIGSIRAIQDDFETILVITHLDEIKDAFPIRIEVRKEPVTGSTFDVIGG